MKSVAKFLVACSCLVFLVVPPIKAAPEGYLEGHLKIVVSTGAAPNEMPRPDAGPGSYAEYPLVILTQQGRKEIKRLTADKNGNYRAALPPGDYVLDVKVIDVEEGTAKHLQANPQPFTIAPNQTVHVDMTVFAGFYKGQA